MASPIVTLLSNRPPEELEGLRAKMQAEKDKLAQEVARLDIELQQVEDAITRQSRRKASKGGSPSTGGVPAWQRVLTFIEESDQPVSPADTRAALSRAGYSGGKSAVYNAFTRLLQMDKIVKVGEGLYTTAPPNGNGSEPAAVGVLENGAHGGSSSHAWPQEGS